MKKQKGVGDGMGGGKASVRLTGMAVLCRRAGHALATNAALLWKKSVLVESKYHNSEQQGSFRLPEQITGPLFYFSRMGD